MLIKLHCMKKIIMLTFAFLPFVVFGQLLKEVKSLHENGNPEEIVFKNQDLEIVSIETYNKDKTLASRYNYDPLTKKVNGEFYSKVKVGDLEYVNKGTYNQNVLSSDQFTQFYGRQIIKGKIVSGLPVGQHKVFNFVSKSYQQYDKSSSRALSRKFGENVNYYVNVESGEFKEEFVCNLNFNDAGLLDGKHVINPYTTLYFENGSINGIIIKNEENKAITKDSIFVGNKIWKRNNEFIKAATKIAYSWPLYNGNAGKFSLKTFSNFGDLSAQNNYLLNFNNVKMTTTWEEFFDEEFNGFFLLEHEPIYNVTNQFGIMRPNPYGITDFLRDYDISNETFPKKNVIRDSEYKNLHNGRYMGHHRVTSEFDVLMDELLTDVENPNPYYEGFPVLIELYSNNNEEFRGEGHWKEGFLKFWNSILSDPNFPFKQFLFCKNIGEKSPPSYETGLGHYAKDCECVNVNEWLAYKVSIIKEERKSRAKKKAKGFMKNSLNTIGNIYR